MKIKQLMFLNVLLFLIQNFCFSSDFQNNLVFSNLDHEELTKQWKSKHYDYAFFPGTCHGCGELKSVLGQRGCLEFGEPDGLCGDCLSVFLGEEVDGINTFYEPITFDEIQKAKLMFGKNALLPAHHVLKDKTMHLCKLTENGIETFIENCCIPEGWNLACKNIKDVLAANQEKKEKRYRIKALPFLCKTCQGFKINETDRQSFLSGNNWFLICSGCGTFFRLNTDNCSILHCQSCSKDGVGVSTCAYCFQVKLDGQIVRIGHKPNHDHQCPSDCVEYFHGDIKINYLPAKMNLICLCKSDND